MPASPTIRLFVSSTFSDLKAERDALQREVFPRLKQLCLSKGLRFQAIDLRWGISEEAGRDNRTIRICLRELRRCQQDRPKPNFLILLGDRYGWRPLPEIIPATLFEQLETKIRAKDANSAKLLTDCYRRDDNAVPPIYELQPRGDNANWHEQVEKPLLAALEQASQNLGLNLEKEGVNIGASATEQEIIEGALKVPDAAMHVRAFFRTIEGLPDLAPEDYVETGEAATRLKKLKDRISGHIGDGNLCRYRVPWRGDAIHADDLKEFCEQAWKRLSGVVEQQIAALAKVLPEEQEEQAHQDFGKERCRRFVGRAEPLKRIASYLREGSGKPLAVIGPSGSGKSAVMAKAVEKVMSDEWRVASEKPEIICRFIGATPASSDLIQLLRSLVGGIRKHYPVAEEGTPQKTSLPDSGEAEKAKPNDSEIPFEYNPLITAFHEALKRPTAERPLCLFLDALDQLTASHNAHSLAWLPGSLTPHVRLIVSAALPSSLDGSAAVVTDPAAAGPLEEGAAADASHTAALPKTTSPLATRPSSLSADPRATIISALTSRLDATQRITLAPLTAADGEQMLTNGLADAQRTLQPAQRQAILDTFQVEGSPLWLRTAAEEAARLASWQPAPAFAPTTPGLLGQVLDRLSREEEHGDKLVSRTLSYLACARHGLAEDEILDILSADKEVMADFRRRSPNSPKVESLPVAVWVRLHGDLAFYLAEHQAQGDSLLGFYHRSFLEAVSLHCFASRETRETRHQHLSVYFLDCAKGCDPAKEWETDAVRGFAECVFHLVKAGQHEQAARLLGNFLFLRHKTRLGLLDGLFEDYDILSHETPTAVGNRINLKKVDSFLHRYAGPLRGYGDRDEMFLQCAQLFFSASRDFAGEIARLEAKAVSVWLRTKVMSKLPSSSESSETRVTELKGHSGWVNLCVLFRNGKLGVTASGDDHSIRIWDLATGKCVRIYEAETRAMTRSRRSGILARIGGSVHRLELTNGNSADIPSEDRAVASVLEDPPSSYDITLDGPLFAYVSGRTVTVQKLGSSSIQVQVEAEREVVAVAISEDGRLVAFSEDSPQFGGKDNRITVWDTMNRRAVMVIESEFRFGIAKLVALGRYLVTQTGRWLRVYDTAHKACVFEESFPIAYGLDALFVDGVLTVLLGCNDSVARCVELPEANTRPIPATTTNAKPSSTAKNDLFELTPTGFLDKVAFATGGFSSMFGVGSYIAHTLYEDGKYDSHYDSPLYQKMFSDRKLYIKGEIKHLLGFLVTSYNGELIVAGDVDGLVHVWQAALPKAALELELDIDHPCGAAFLPGDHSILIAGHHEMRIYKFPSFEMLRSVKAPNHLGFVTLAMAQHGRIAATANGNEVAIWSLPDFRMHGTAAVSRDKFEDGVRFCSFDATGEILAAASSSGTVYFYSSADCRLLGTRRLDGECIDLVWCWEYLCALTADGYIHFVNPRTRAPEIVYCEKLFLPHCIGRIESALCCVGGNSEIILLGREKATQSRTALDKG